MSSVKVTVPPNFTTPLTPNLKSSINNALLASNAIPKIQAALLHECQASGFIASLRARTLELLRSGECNSYGEIMDRIMGELKGGNEEGKGIEVNGGSKEGGDVNGDTAGSAKRLRVPTKVIEEGVKIVRGAVEGCVEVAVEE